LPTPGGPVNNNATAQHTALMAVFQRRSRLVHASIGPD
jgi:hypothetical protein